MASRTGDMVVSKKALCLSRILRQQLGTGPHRTVQSAAVRRGGYVEGNVISRAIFAVVAAKFGAVQDLIHILSQVRIVDQSVHYCGGRPLECRQSPHRR